MLQVPEGEGKEQDCTELTLTFKLGQHHVLVANSLQRPNSAVRQLFPSAEPDKAAQGDAQFLVTAESLRLFEEAKRAKLAQLCNEPEDRSQIRRTIERNTLRRSHFSHFNALYLVNVKILLM